MTFERVAQNVETHAVTALRTAFAEDIRFVVDVFREEDDRGLVVKHVPSGVQYLLEVRAIPMGTDG